MATTPPAITAPDNVAREVLYHFGDYQLGYEPGSFIASLLVTMGRADRSNFARLALVFPDYADAFHQVINTSAGLEQLRDQVKAHDGYRRLMAAIDNIADEDDTAVAEPCS